MWVKKRHKFFTGLLRPFFRLHFHHKYNLKSTYHKELKGRQFLVIANHSTTMDPFLVGGLFPFPLYYLASSDLFIKPLVGGFIKHLVNPIPINKSRQDMKPILNAIQVAREGGSICVFPEGNRTYSGKLGHMDKSITKFIKFLKLDVAIVNIVGGYGTDPRWSYDGNIRKGQMSIDIKKIVKYDEVKNIDNEDLFKMIRDELSCDPIPSTNHYRSKRCAEGLERILYKCPNCLKWESIFTKGQHVYCKYCDLDVTYNDNLTFTSNGELYKLNTVSSWYDWQLNELDKTNLEKDETMFSAKDVNLFTCRIGKGRKRIFKKGYLGISQEEIAFRNKKDSIDIKIDDIQAFTCMGRKKFNFYIDDVIYQVKGKKDLATLKFMHYFYLAKHKGGKDNEFWGI